MAPLLGGLGGLFGGLVFITAGAVVGQSGFLTAESLKVVLIASLYDALIAPIVFPIVRRAARRDDTNATWRVPAMSRCRVPESRRRQRSVGEDGEP